MTRTQRVNSSTTRPLASRSVPDNPPNYLITTNVFKPTENCTTILSTTALSYNTTNQTITRNSRSIKSNKICFQNSLRNRHHESDTIPQGKGLTVELSTRITTPPTGVLAKYSSNLRTTSSQ